MNSQGPGGKSHVVFFCIAGGTVFLMCAIAFFCLQTREQGPVSIAGTKPVAAEKIRESREARKFDHARVGNESHAELLNQKINQQLKKIAKLCSTSKPIGSVSKIAGNNGLFASLRPANLRETFQSSELQIKSLAHNVDFGPAVTPHQGPEGFSNALNKLIQPFEGLDDRRAKFKVYKVTPSAGQVETEQYLSIFGKSESGSREVNTVWHCVWSCVGAGEPILDKLTVLDFEEAVLEAPTKTLFSEITTAVLDGNSSFRDQLSLGCDYWSARNLFSPITGYQGLAVGDVNGDGLEDFYICQESTLPNRLFVQNPDGTATDRSAEAGVDWLEGTRHALFVDLDNDSDQDLVVATSGWLVMMANDGQGNFETKSTLRAARNGFSLTAVDYNNDGNLDIYVCVYFPLSGSRELIALPRLYHDANTGGRNLMIQNDGNWEFSDVTQSCGLEENNRRFSLAASWEDFDNDGDMDLYVANDYGRNNLYRNDGGKFSDVAAQLGVEDQSFGMSADWADCNQDGRMDLYVANMFSAAGTRATHQDEFRAGDEATRNRFQYIARGNSLFLNRDDESGFVDSSHQSNAMMGRWSWGSRFVDINNDSWEDIVVPNGYLTRESTHDL